MAASMIRQILESHKSYEGPFEAYKPDTIFIDQLRHVTDPFELFLFMGDWCPDCRTQVPRLMKILHQLDELPVSLRVVEVDRQKKDAAGLAEAYGVLKSPTMLFLRGGIELGRIIEAPEVSMEADIARILLASSK